ncbi:MAG TPA: FAD-binding oxidoreductase [Armatimonadota bacterium]|nr:FAD-binding oxidoreductase [Armatimonadota bacterium]
MTAGTQTDSSYLKEMLCSELVDVVGEDDVTERAADKLAYACDYYWIPAMWIDRKCSPPTADWIVHPESAEEVSRILKIADRYHIPVVTWGGGSGSQGGALPIYGGIILDTKKMNRVVKIDHDAMTVTVQTGIITEHLEWALQKEGVSTMHYPASIQCATLGGFLAHRGTGVLSTKYGKIEDMTVSMQVVLPDGKIINTLPVPRHAAGPDLNQIFLGSEGTLGVITEATLKIHPIPEARKFQAFVFNSMHEAMEAGKRIMISRLGPSVIRLYDEAETKKLIKRVLGIDKTGAYLVFGFEGNEDIVDLQLQAAVKICLDLHAEDLGTEMGKSWWDNRYKFFYPPYMFALPQAFGTLDTVATFSNIENVYWGMKHAVETNFPEATFIGHFSHWYDWGCMLYARFIVDNPPEDPHEAAALYNRIWDTGVRASIAAGGVLNEHHGIGLKLGRLMKEQYGEAYSVLERIKGALDPHNIMNPGKMGFSGVGGER